MRSRVFIKMACCIMCIMVLFLGVAGCGKESEEDSRGLMETASLAESEPETITDAGSNMVQGEDTIEETLPELTEETIAETETPELQFAEEEILLDDTCFFEWDGNNDGYNDILHYVEMIEGSGGAWDCYELFIWQPEQECYEKVALIPVNAIDYENHKLYRRLQSGSSYIGYTVFGLQDRWYEEDKTIAFDYAYAQDENGHFLARATYSVNYEVVAEYDITDLTWGETVSLLEEKYPEFDYWWKQEEYPQIPVSENITLWDGNDDGYEDILIYRGTDGGSGGLFLKYDLFVWSPEDKIFVKTELPQLFKIDYETHKLYNRGQVGASQQCYQIYALRDGEYQVEKKLWLNYESKHVEGEDFLRDIAVYTDWNGVEEETDITGLTWDEIKELMESKYPEFNFWREG